MADAVVGGAPNVDAEVEAGENGDRVEEFPKADGPAAPNPDCPDVGFDVAKAETPEVDPAPSIGGFVGDALFVLPKGEVAGLAPKVDCPNAGLDGVDSGPEAPNAGLLAANAPKPNVGPEGVNFPVPCAALANGLGAVRAQGKGKAN